MRWEHRGGGRVLAGPSDRSGRPARSRWDLGHFGFAGAIALAGVLLLAHGIVLLASLDAAGAARALLGALLGIAAADAVTGFVHWACDSWGDERTPWLGPALIRSFREHHENPQAILAHDWVVANREPGAAAAVALAGLSVPAVHAFVASRPTLYAGLCTLIAWGAAANQLHLWAHAPRPPRWVRLAQRGGLVLSRDRHARHHRGARDAAYCISTGWLNPLLDRTGFWRGLERAITAWAGIEARAPRSETGRSGSG
jgi:ubiquitin-conjugating enzyme E2 variant